MQSVQDALNSILDILPRLAHQESIEEHVATVLTSLDQLTPSELRRTQWEFVLRQEVFALAVCTTLNRVFKAHSVLILSVGN